MKPLEPVLFGGHPLRSTHQNTVSLLSIHIPKEPPCYDIFFGGLAKGTLKSIFWAGAQVL